MPLRATAHLFKTAAVIFIGEKAPAGNSSGTGPIPLIASKTLMNAGAGGNEPIT